MFLRNMATMRMHFLHTEEKLNTDDLKTPANMYIGL